MKTAFLFCVRWMYEIRRLNSLLLAAIFFYFAYLIWNDISEISVQALIPISLYLLTEAGLLLFYLAIVKQKQKRTISYYKLNKKRKIIIDNSQDESQYDPLPLVGNLFSFWSLSRNFIDLSWLIKSKKIGLIISATMFVEYLLFSMTTIQLELIGLLAIAFLILLKMEKEDFPRLEQ